MQAFGVIVELDNPDKRMRIGVTADVRINSYRNPQAMVVERKDILKESDKHFVYVVNNGIAEKREVVPGRLQGLDVEIIEGLNPDEELIIEGQMLLEEGGKVKIVM
jgi:multidrug efflux pump subunit AcrA (membrane-fusion protein)